MLKKLAARSKYKKSSNPKKTKRKEKVTVKYAADSPSTIRMKEILIRNNNLLCQKKMANDSVGEKKMKKFLSPASELRECVSGSSSL